MVLGCAYSGARFGMRKFLELSRFTVLGFFGFAMILHPCGELSLQ